MENGGQAIDYFEFDALADTIADIVYRINEDGKFTYLNPAIRRLGYEPNELIGKHFSELILPADIKAVSRKYILPHYIGKIIGNKAPKLFDERRSIERRTSQLEVRLKPKGIPEQQSGIIESIGENQIIVEVSSCGIYRNNQDTKSGVFIGTVGVIREITDQRWMEADLIRYSERLEKQLKESKDLSITILENSPIGIFIVCDRKFQYVNRTFTSILGYRQEQLIGENPLDFVIPEDRESVRLQAIRMLKSGLSYPYKYRVIDANGKTKWIRETVITMRYRGKPATLGNFIDVTGNKQMEGQLKQSGEKYSTRKVAEKALLESESNFRNSIEHSPLGVRIVTAGGETIYANRTVLEMYGYDSVIDFNAIPIVDRLTPESYVAARERAAKRKRGEYVPPDYEISIVRKNGEIRHLGVTRGEIIWNGTKQFESIYRDITDIRIAEEKLKQSIADQKKAEAGLRLQAQILDSQMDVVIVHDPQGHVIYANQAACVSHGYTEEELLKMNLRDLTDARSGQLISSRIQEILEKGQASFESTHIRKDQSLMPLEIHSHVAEWSGRKLIISVERDITERKAAEQRLRESEARYRGIFNQVPVSIFILDKNGIVLDVNPYHAVVINGQIPVQSFIGKSIFENPGNSEAGILEDHKRLLKGERINLEGIHLSPSNWGPERYFNIRGVPLKERGEVSGAILIIEDITNRKKAEQQLKESYEKLQQTFAGVTKVISDTVELRDPYTAGHQVRVAHLAKALATEMNLTEDHASQIYTAALIHDIGKISIPTEILSRPGNLKAIEFALIKKHPEAGYDILKNIDFPYPLARWVLEHHERINGSGYPKGISGENISLEAKILAVADVVEAIASHRPYRPSLDMGAAIDEIKKNKGILYDDIVVDACFRLFYEKGFKLRPT